MALRCGNVRGALEAGLATADTLERLIDVFYVLDAKGQKIIDAGFQREVVHGLLYSLGLKEA